MASEISREDLRPSQIQYQLLTAQLAIGDSYDSVEEAPDGVNEALEHIKTAMNLVSDPDEPLDECRPSSGIGLPEGSGVRSELSPRDWRELAESDFVDIGESAIAGDTAFVFLSPSGKLHGFRWREASRTLESVTFSEVGADE